MAKDRLSGPVRRVAAVSVAVVAVIAGAGALTTWRYEVGLSRATVAIDDRADARTAVGLSAAFWRERQAMLSYLVYGLPTLMHEVTTQRDEFQQLVTELGSPGTAAEARSLTQAAAAFAHYYSVFTQVKGAAVPPGAGFAAVVRLEAAAAAVPAPLDTLDGLYVSRAQAAQRAAVSASG